MANPNPIQAFKTLLLPNGISTSGTLLFSVLMSPELYFGATPLTLANFPDMQNWPGRLQDADASYYGFELTFQPPGETANGSPYPAFTTFVHLSQADQTYPLNPDLWTTLFGPSTPYQSPASAAAGGMNLPVVGGVSPAEAPIISYPATPITGFATGQFANLPLFTKPTLADVQSVYGPVAEGLVGVTGEQTLAAQAAERRAAVRGGRIAQVNDFSGATVAEALVAQSYYFRPPIQPPSPQADQDGAQLSPDPSQEFHAALTMISHHRALQRALGLVFDFSLGTDYDLLHEHPGANWTLTAAFGTYGLDPDAPAFSPFVAASPPGKPTVTSIGVTPPLLATLDVSSSTPAFYADDPPSAPYSYGLNGGYVNIGYQGTGGGGGTYEGTPMSIERVGLNTASFAQTVKLKSGQLAGGIGTPEADVFLDEVVLPPSLSSSGIAVTLEDSAIVLSAILARQSQLQQVYDPTGTQYTSTAYPIGASDVIRGFALDVQDLNEPNSTFLSLNQRNVTYQPQTSGAFSAFDSFDEAGLTNPPSFGLAPPDGDLPQLYIAETLMRFTGWSNAVPRPGTPIQDADASLDANGPFSDVLDITVSGSPILAGSTNPSILIPKLRFGRQYSLRIRVVDLANNAVPLDQDNNDNDDVISGVPYPRLDVIASPDVYPQNGYQAYPAAGESRLNVVIRDADGPGTFGARIFAPPRVTPDFAITSGLLDTASGELDAGASDAAGVYNWLIAADSGQWAYVTPWGGASRGTPPPSSEAIPSIDVTQGVPYIADPLARGGALRVDVSDANNWQNSDAAQDGLGSPDTNATPAMGFLFDFQPGGTAPNTGTYELVQQSQGSDGTPSVYTAQSSQPVRFQLVPAGAGAARSITYDQPSRTVQAALQPGDVVTLDLSSTFNPTDLNPAATPGSSTPGGSSLALFQQAQKGFDATLAAEGACWSVTPAKQLTLVYATQRPLVTPTFTPLVGTKNIGDTFVSLGGNMEWGPNSTSHVDVFAAWTDPVDDGPGTAPPDAQGISYARVPVPATGAGSFESLASAGTERRSVVDQFSSRQEFRDTKARLVNYSAVATTRFAEYFPGYGIGQLQNPDPNAGAPAETPVQVKSSARPAAVAIDAVVPTFGWNVPARTNKEITSQRTPGGLRIYLERPWWSSGAGELLGVITWPGAEPGAAGGSPIADPIHQYVSDWGLDPLFASGEGLASSHPSLAAFTAATATATTLGLEEIDGVFVNVAGHAVSYDQDSERWYADIAVDFGRAYNPMVRLAVARYQPESVPGVELGRVSLVDVHVLDQGRTVTITRHVRGQVKVTLTGVSYTKGTGMVSFTSDGQEASSSIPTVPGLAVVQLQRRNPQIDDPVLGWQPVDDPVTMQADLDSHTGVATWTALVTVPAGSGYRLAVMQYELLQVRASVGNGAELGQRLMFQDLIDLGFRD